MARRPGRRPASRTTQAIALSFLGLLLVLQAVSLLQSCFTLCSQRPAQRRIPSSRDVGSRGTSSSRKSRTAREVVTPGLEALGTPPPGAAFEPSQLSIGVAFGLFVVGLPGIASTIQRTGQAKFVEKTYVMPGTAQGGLQMRSIAGGVVAYFRSLNYIMEDSSQEGKIRFVGQMQGNFGQAAYLTGCLAGAIFAAGLLLVSLFPDGPFGIGPDWWFTPIIVSPWAGWYYWQRAFRKDIVELQLQMTEDRSETTLITLGSQDTIEELQAGVRFQSETGKLFRLMERGMEYQPGIFESSEGVKVVKEKPIQEAAKEPVRETA